MAKINFTKEHLEKMKSLAVKMLLDNTTIPNNLGMPLNIVELLHTTTITNLNNIRLSLKRKIDSIENRDEWVATEQSSASLEVYKTQKELVNLIIGYKRKCIEVEDAKRYKASLEMQLKQLEESQKSPEDKINEIKAALLSIDNVEF